MSYPLAIFAPYIGGQSETFIRRHMRDLQDGRTAVIAGSADKPYGGYWGVDGPLLVLNRVESRLINRGVQAIGRRVGWNAGERFVRNGVKSFLKDHGVRVAIGEFLSWSVSWLDTATDLGIPFFGHAHGFDVSANLRDRKWRAEYVRYRNAEGVITMSEYSRARLADVGLSSKSIHVVPYGVDVPPQLPARTGDREIRCLIVGRMVPKKPPILNLDAFRRAADAWPTLRLDYVGAGELLPAAQQFVKAFGLESRVNLLGGQSAEVVSALMQRADIFLLHSMTDPDTGDEEGLPVAILEAMGHGLPVISTRHAGIPEAVADGSSGFLVDEGDSKGMADCLITMARDVDLRRRMGHAGWQIASNRFTWERERSSLCRLLGFDDSPGESGGSC
jgi:colanic acid/amylovoran biosynthesis glycosyltransferase